MTLPCQRHLFAIPRDVCYLNSAYMSPMPAPVRDAGAAGLARRATPWEIRAEDFFEPAEALRRQIGNLLNASPERIALVPNAANGIATVAKNLALQPGRQIVVLGEQFPSNMYSWLGLADRSAHIKVVEAPTGAHRGRKWNERLLAAIGPDTGLVAIEGAHWTDGTLFDLVAVGRRCREVGAWFVVDATQSIGIEPIDISVIQPDALVAHPYKSLLASYGLGFAYFSDRLAGGSPLEESWLMRRGSEDFARLVDYQQHYAPGMRRYDSSTRANLALVGMLSAALELFRDWQPPRVRAYCAHVSGRLKACAQRAGYDAPQDGEHAAHIFGIRPPKGTDLQALRRALQDGHVYVSVRGDAIRVSPHVYNDQIDIDHFAQVLHA
ncbi:MAG TPA: aminotransferase class V-fold PLP-dependent enzyme [Burkholderiaceae bacterium]|nr:aminotransferase class V-fold PLP-dependent enzyme [Burkholderiaceae bacterium]